MSQVEAMGVYRHGCRLEFCNPQPTHTCDAGMAGFVMSWIRQLAGCHIHHRTQQWSTNANAGQWWPMKANPAHPWPLNHTFWPPHNHPPCVLNLHHTFPTSTTYFWPSTTIFDLQPPVLSSYNHQLCILNLHQMFMQVFLASTRCSQPPPGILNLHQVYNPQHMFSTSSTCLQPPACILKPPPPMFHPRICVCVFPEVFLIFFLIFFSLLPPQDMHTCVLVVYFILISLFIIY